MAPKKTTKSKKPDPQKPAARNPKERGLGRGLSALMSDINPDLVAVNPQKALTQKPKSNRKSKPKVKPAKKQSKTTVRKTAVKTPKKAVAKAKAKPVKKPINDGQGRGILHLSIDQLERNPDQPRRYFDKEKLVELTVSIKDKGVLQPILVRPIPKKDGRTKSNYQIVAGERRWQAAMKAGLTTMPALVRSLSDQQVLEIGVVENVQRADLNPVEEALAYKALVDDFRRTQEDIANAVGKSRPHIANMLRLLTLPKRAQALLAKGKISTGHARAIIAAPDPTELADAIAEKGLSVREAEEWVRRIKASNGKVTRMPSEKDADTRKVEKDLADVLGLKVDLRHKTPGGELRVKYKTGDQLEALIKRLMR